jgi:hypothetical protein
MSPYFSSLMVVVLSKGCGITFISGLVLLVVVVEIQAVFPVVPPTPYSEYWLILMVHIFLCVYRGEV